MIGWPKYTSHTVLTVFGEHWYARDDRRFYYQDVKLSKYPEMEHTVLIFHGDCVMRISKNVERRFENLCVEHEIK